MENLSENRTLGVALLFQSTIIRRATNQSTNPAASTMSFRVTTLEAGRKSDNSVCFICRMQCNACTFTFVFVFICHACFLAAISGHHALNPSSPFERSTINRDKVEICFKESRLFLLVANEVSKACSGPCSGGTGRCRGRCAACTARRGSARGRGRSHREGRSRT
jgi:hypothetical protein